MFTSRYYVSVLTVVLGGSAQFYSYGIVNPAQTLITEWINTTYFERSGVPLNTTELNFLWSFVVGCISIGAIIGALMTRFVSERCGRRNGLFINGIVNVLGAGLELFAKPLKSPEILILGRFVLGANMGLTSGLVPMYLMEITPSKYRGPAGTLHQVAVAFADWFSLLIGLPEVLGGSTLWPIAFAFPGIAAFLLVLILPCCPESPKHLLVTLKDRQAALDACRCLVGDERAQSMYEEIVREHIEEQSDTPGTFRELFTSSATRVPLAASALVMLAQQFTGCTAVFAYSTDMFVNARLDLATARYSTLAIGIVYFLFACSAPLLIERVGRRPLLLFQLCACFFSLALLTTFTALQAYSTMEWASYGTIGAMVLYMCVYGVGSPIPWMITSELFNQKFRSMAVTVSVFIAWFFAFVISSAYLPFQQLVGVSLSYTPFLVVLAVMIVLMYFLLPETRHRAPSVIVEEVRYRSASLSALRPWEAARAGSRSEIQRLLDHMESPPSHYASTDGMDG